MLNFDPESIPVPSILSGKISVFGFQSPVKNSVLLGILSVPILLLLLLVLWPAEPEVDTIGKATGTQFGAQIGLQAVRRVGGVHITWDRNSALLQSAVSGSLLITDDLTTTTIPLSEVQIRFGQYFLAPYTENLHLALDLVQADGHHVRDSASGVGPDTPGASPAVSAEQTAALLQRYGLPDVSRSRLSPVSPPSNTANVAKSASTRSPIVATTASAQTNPDSQTATANSTASANAEHAAPESAPLQMAAAATPLETPLTKPLPEQVIHQPEQAAQPTAPPIHQPAEQSIQPVTPRTPSKLGRISSFTPPVPILQTPVDLPILFKAAVRSSPVEVEVLTVIDSSGRVKSAVPKRRLTGISSHLFEMARTAVMTWRFSPAVLDDKKVEAEYTIRFKFGR